MASTTAQEALKAFEDGWLTLNWSALSSTQKTTHVHTHYGLKIDAAKEIEANTVEAEAAQETANTERLLSVENSLKALGYACDNSESDWDKLYNKRTVYGDNWKAQADSYRDLSTGKEYFLNHAQGILYANYQVNYWYDVKDTFYYNGQLYEVIQAHKSQADWLPDSTPALYKAAVLPNEVAEWVQPTGAHDAYNIGDKVLFNGSTYESLINANVWSPTAYPQGWKLI